MNKKYYEWKLCKDGKFRKCKKKYKSIKREGNWESYCRERRIFHYREKDKKRVNSKITIWNSYSEYCKSKEFKKWKRKVLNKYKHKCIICGDKATIAHHTNYRIWGTEKVKDGVAVCQYHHDFFHYDKEVDKWMKAHFD